MPTATNWQLDLLGNWSGGTAQDSLVTYTIGSGAGSGPGYDDNDTWTDKRRDTSDQADRIVTLREEENGQASVESDFYDDDGNLVLDDKHLYVYDAWNRVGEVKELE